MVVMMNHQWSPIQRMCGLSQTVLALKTHPLSKRHWLNGLRLAIEGGGVAVMSICVPEQNNRVPVVVPRWCHGREENIAEPTSGRHD